MRRGPSKEAVAFIVQLNLNVFPPALKSRCSQEDHRPWTLVVVVSGKGSCAYNMVHDEKSMKAIITDKEANILAVNRYAFPH